MSDSVLEGNGQIIVTGASKGIGAAIAKELSQQGAEVVCLSRSGTAPAGRGMVCDMTDEAAIKNCFAEIAEHGAISGLVNNAGIHFAAPSAEMETADYERVMRLNATAAVIACREIYPYLKATGGGRIVNIGSFFDKLGVAGHLAYCASKAAVGAISRCLAVEWAKDGIRVNNIAPGYIETDLNRDFLAREKVRDWLGKRIPVAKVGQAEEVARLVSMLMLQPVTFMTGETIYIDGGQAINH